jgi:membrane associated rhomboid family serine protease
LLPIRDSVRRRRFPWVNTVLLCTNLGLFAYLAWLGPDGEGIIRRYGLIPGDLTGGGLLWRPSLPALFTLVTATFLHGSWLHVGGNMLYLWVFGDNLEDAMGPGRYLVYYLLAGVVGMLAHVAALPASRLPTIGASGAVAGVLGGYMVLHPRARVLTLIPLVFVAPAIQLPAVLYLAFWFFLQLFSGWFAATAGLAQPVAWWAHVGGFLAGVLLVRPFGRWRLTEG